MTTPEPDSQQFVRDRLTWLGYLMIGNYCFLLAGLGPLMPFMRSELHLSYTMGAYHFSAWAFGVLMAGMSGDRVMRKFGRARVIWGCAAGLSMGVSLLVTMRDPIFTIFGAGLCGIMGSIMGQTVNTVMADRFQASRALAITEANIAASIACALSPLVISTCERIGWGWRTAVLLPIAAFGLEALLFRGAMAKVPPHQHASSALKPLPAAYWAFWTVVLFSVAAEWSIIFWSAEFLERVINLAKADASAAVTAYLAAMLFGRIIGSRLTRFISISRLLPCASALAIAGFLLFWLSRYAPMNIVGLFISGLGMANFYPLTLSAAISTAPDRTSTATARMSVSTGTACLSAPLLLGWIADHVGIARAYGVVFILLLIAAGMVLLANWMSHRHYAVQQAEREVSPVA